jgi:hypothetical protein
VEYVQQDYRTAGEDGQAGTYDKVGWWRVTSVKQR